MLELKVGYLYKDRVGDIIIIVATDEGGSDYPFAGFNSRTRKIEFYDSDGSYNIGLISDEDLVELIGEFHA